MPPEFLLVNSELAELERLLALLQTQFVYLLSQFLLRFDELLSQHLNIAVSLLQLRLRLLCDLFLDTEHFFKDFDVLLERARHLLVLL